MCVFLYGFDFVVRKSKSDHSIRMKEQYMAIKAEQGNDSFTVRLKKMKDEVLRRRKENDIKYDYSVKNSTVSTAAEKVSAAAEVETVASKSCQSCAQ